MLQLLVHQLRTCLNPNVYKLPWGITTLFYITGLNRYHQ